MTLQNDNSNVSIENSWFFDGGLWQDPDLLKVKKSLLRYRPEPIRLEELEQKEGVLTLRGPRRAGKTVALKLLIAAWFEKQNSTGGSHDWVWLDFDLFRALHQGETLIKRVVEKFSPKFIVIDEVSSLQGWQKLIKKLRDDGTLANRITILTGSSAHDIKTGAERMAGRRGDFNNSDRVLLPMSFQSFREQVRPHIEKSDFELYELYLKVGGFPFRVSNFIQHKDRYEELGDFSIFDDILFYEINRRRLDRSTAIEILRRISAVGIHAVSYQSFAKILNMTKETARRYLDALGDAFLLATVSTFDTGRNRVSLKKDKKFLWIDPALHSFGNWMRFGDETSMAHRVESAILRDLLDTFEWRLFEGLSNPRSVFTWKSTSGKEVDFLIVDQRQRLPVEIKYQNEISDWDFQVIERAFGQGILVTKKIQYAYRKSQALPAHEFDARRLILKVP